MTKPKHLAFSELIGRKQPFEIFRMINSGELTPINKATGKPVPNTPDHHEYSVSRQAPTELQNILWDLETSLRILQDKQNLTNEELSPLGSRLKAFFACSLNEISLKMVQTALASKLGELREHETREVQRFADDPSRKKWEYLLLPQNEEESNRLMHHLASAVFIASKVEQKTIIEKQRLMEVAKLCAHRIQEKREKDGLPPLTAPQYANHPSVLTVWRNATPPAHSYLVRQIKTQWGLNLRKGRPPKEE